MQKARWTYFWTSQNCFLGVGWRTELTTCQCHLREWEVETAKGHKTSSLKRRLKGWESDTSQGPSKSGGLGESRASITRTLVTYVDQTRGGVSVKCKGKKINQCLCFLHMLFGSICRQSWHAAVALRCPEGLQCWTFKAELGTGLCITSSTFILIHSRVSSAERTAI